MECVEGAKGPARRHVGGQIADRSVQLPQIAARPKRVEIALCVREVRLGRATLLSDPQQRTGRFHEGKSRSDEHRRCSDARFDLRGCTLLERGTQSHRGIEIEGRAHEAVKCDPA